MDSKDCSPSWSLVDSAAISLSMVVAAALRFWHLGTPAEPIYDETKVLNQAQSFLHGWAPPFSSHPPGGKLLVALSVFLFGNIPWGWRAANALMGTALVPITYLLARRLFRSKLAAAVAAALLLCEGMLLVASRLAMINAAYVTLGAGAYLMLWCFVQEREARTQRLYLLAMSVLLGLYVGTKAVISEVGVLLALAVVILALLGRRPKGLTALSNRRVIGACGLVVSMVLLVYFAMFLPFYWVGWGGLADFMNYHRNVIYRNLDLPLDFPNASPFWSWPLLLHPYAYSRKDILNGTAEVIWCGGNPLLWWAILPAILMAFIRGYTRRSLAWTFMAAGYVAYLAMWIAIRRYVFIYSYMPAEYLGLLALAGALEECWVGHARAWEQFLLLAPVVVCLILAFGALWGALAVCLISIAYPLVKRRFELRDGKFVFLIFISAALLLWAYFFPLWTGIPLSETGYMARMWLHGQGLASWL